MAIHRTQKNSSNPFVMIDKRVLEDTRLSQQTRFAFIRMLSRPDHWQFHIHEMVKWMGVSEPTLKRIFSELKKHGYLTITSSRREDGTFESHIYNLFEQPTFGHQPLDQICASGPIHPLDHSTTSGEMIPLSNIERSEINNEREKEALSVDNSDAMQHDNLAWVEPPDTSLQASPDEPESTPPNPSSLDDKAREDFEAWWQTWPGAKTGKTDAWLMWKGKRPPMSKAIVANQLLQETRSMLTDANIEPPYLKSAANWLRGECWNDEISVQGTAKYISQKKSANSFRSSPSGDYAQNGVMVNPQSYKPCNLPDYAATPRDQEAGKVNFANMRDMLARQATK